MINHNNYRDTIMNDLVKLVNNTPLVSTFDLFERMGYKEHRKLKEVVLTNIEHFNEIGFLPLEREKPTSKKGGRPIEGYLLSEDHFVLLVMLAKNNVKVVELKVRVAKEFRRMKYTLAKIASQSLDPQWQNTRSDGKIVYRQKTDVIKEFVEYATKQGSKSANTYYMNLAKMENGSLFFIEQKYENLRDIITIKQLMQVCTADDVIDKALSDGMKQDMHYKDIYKLAKERISSFVSVIGRSHVHDLMIGCDD